MSTVHGDAQPASEAVAQVFGEALADDGSEIIGLIEPLLVGSPQPSNAGAESHAYRPSRSTETVHTDTIAHR